MRKGQFSEEQIVGIVRLVGHALGDACRQHGIGDANYCRWKVRYGGLGACELRRR